MRPSSATKPRLALLLALAFAGTVGFGFGGRGYDDGLITYRYAANLADGRGLVFNPGERVLGTSAPGYAVVLGALGALASPLGGDLAWIGAILSILSIVALVALLSTAPIAVARADGAALAFAFLALSARFNLELLGCETLPAVALASWGIVLALGDASPALAGILLGSATAFRFDSGLAAIVVAAALLLERRGARLVRIAAAASAVVLPLLLGLWRFFGGFVPNTLAGKRSELGLVASTYTRAEWDWWTRSFGSLGAAWLLAASAVGILALLLASRHPESEPRHARHVLAVIAAWLVAHEIFYRVVGVPFSPWYHVGLELALLGLASVGALAMATFLLRQARVPQPASLTVVLLSFALLLPVVSANSAFVATFWREPADPRFHVYRDLALWVRARSAPTASIATVEIGAIGYYSDRAVLDLVGLVDRDLLEAKREGRLAEAVARRTPEFIVDVPTFHDPYLAPLLARPEIQRDFRLVGTFFRPDYPVGVRLLARRSSLPGPS